MQFRKCKRVNVIHVATVCYRGSTEHEIEIAHVIEVTYTYVYYLSMLILTLVTMLFKLQMA